MCLIDGEVEKQVSPTSPSGKLTAHLWLPWKMNGVNAAGKFGGVFARTLTGAYEYDVHCHKRWQCIASSQAEKKENNTLIFFFFLRD
jgi:hypothetical protein